ncbi:hypothetical protein GCM10010256_79650 [Streptomyces coeruleorubidus]|nr:hypothetical protein GCM10010256_79650 [Streptomyces coeruleorubidus]
MSQGVGLGRGPCRTRLGGAAWGRGLGAVLGRGTESVPDTALGALLGHDGWVRKA